MGQTLTISSKAQWDFRKLGNLGRNFFAQSLAYKTRKYEILWSSEIKARSNHSGNKEE